MDQNLVFCLRIPVKLVMFLNLTSEGIPAKLSNFFPGFGGLA